MCFFLSLGAPGDTSAPSDAEERRGSEADVNLVRHAVGSIRALDRKLLGEHGGAEEEDRPSLV